MRTIDADALAEYVKTWQVGEGIGSKQANFLEAIKAAPTVDAEPVRHGEWEGNGLPASKLWHCSVCRRLTETAYYCDHCYYSYCPNCGAKMGGKENEHEF